VWVAAFKHQYSTILKLKTRRSSLRVVFEFTKQKNLLLTITVDNNNKHLHVAKTVFLCFLSFLA